MNNNYFVDSILVIKDVTVLNKEFTTWLVCSCGVLQPHTAGNLSRHQTLHRSHGRRRVPQTSSDCGSGSAGQSVGHLCSSVAWKLLVEQPTAVYIIVSSPVSVLYAHIYAMSRCYFCKDGIYYAISLLRMRSYDWAFSFPHLQILNSKTTLLVLLLNIVWKIIFL